MRGMWWWRNGELVAILLFGAVVIIGVTALCVWAPGAPHHVYHQNYQCPFG